MSKVLLDFLINVEGIRFEDFRVISVNMFNFKFKLISVKEIWFLNFKLLVIIQFLTTL